MRQAELKRLLAVAAAVKPAPKPRKQTTKPAVEFWTPPAGEVYWNENDFLQETPGEPMQVPCVTSLQVVLREAVDEALEVAVELDQPTEKELKQRLELRYAYIREKLFAEQWDGLCKAVYFYGIRKQNCQVIAPTGQGKTYYLAGLLRILTDYFPAQFDFMHPDNAGRTPPIVITPPKVIAQTMQVFAEFGVIAMVTSLASLRNTLGESCLEFRTVVLNGQPMIYPFWLMHCATMFMSVDESQQVKNEDSVQSQIIESCAACGIPTHFMSATPYSRVSQAKIIACAIAPEVPNPANPSARGFTLTDKVWPSFAKSLCPDGYSPTDWSPSALRSLQFYLEPYTIRWAIPYPHKVLTKIVSCEFATPAEAQSYNEVFQEWNEIRAKRELDPLVGIIAELVALQKFNQRAEELRAPHLVRAGVELWLDREKKALKDRRKKRISVIFGFAYATSLERAEVALKAILGEEEFRKKVAVIRGGQNCDKDKDLFQADKKQFLLLTIACGGAGLSLDNNQYNRRQRYMFCSAVWNDIQMAQLAGRTQRLKTTSASYMYIMYYKNTKEYEKLQKVLYKVRCLKEITTKVVSRDMDRESENSGNFVDDISQIEYHDGGKRGAPPPDEEQEESAAELVVGTKQAITFAEAPDDEEDSFDE